MHELYLGIGSNLGDRQANLLAALQRLRARAEIFALSGFYESQAAGGASGPPYLNVAVGLRYERNREAFERFARDVELAVGRAREVRRLEPRPIDIDLLVFDGEIVQLGLDDRPYDAVPLREIAPQFVTMRGTDGVTRLERTLRFETDVQSEPPEVRLSLRRAGVTGVRRVVHLEIDGVSNVYNADFSMVADVALDRSGVHMSRFAEALEEATLDVLADSTQPARIERLAETIASAIVSGQRASSADVRLQARFALERWTPVSGKRGEETYVLIGLAHAGSSGTRRVVGVEAEGMTACPCAQGMMREHWLHDLMGAGFSEADARRALDVLPAATHNQRGRGTLLLGTADERSDLVRAEDLVEIVENAMSSETYDLLKRPDEFFVVNKAHHRPRFVEDVVRAMLARTLELYADFSDDSFVFAGQVNEESIHKHDAFAEAFGLFTELRGELRGETTEKTDLAGWLGSGALRPLERRDARTQ
jgi:GTP cyclohydrolase-4